MASSAHFESGDALFYFPRKFISCIVTEVIQSIVELTILLQELPRLAIDLGEADADSVDGVIGVVIADVEVDDPEHLVMLDAVSDCAISMSGQNFVGQF